MGTSHGWRFSDWPLQWKINIVALLVFLPTMFGGIAYFMYEVYQLEVKTALAGLMNFVDAKQQGVIRFIGQNEKLSRQLADLADNVDANALRRHIKTIVDTDVFNPDQHPFKDEIASGKRRIPTWKTYHAIEVIKDGRIEISSDPSREGTPWTHDLKFNNGYSSVYRDGENLLLTFGAPTHNGTLLVHVDARMLTVLVNGEIGNMEGSMGTFYLAGVGKTMDFYMVDQDNTLITESRLHKNAILRLKGSETPWKITTQDISTGIVCTADGTYTTNAGSTTGCRETMGFYDGSVHRDEDHPHDSRLMLGVSMPFYDSNWTIVVEQEANELLMPLWTVGALILLVSGMLVIISFLAFIRMANKHIVRPLSDLSDAIKQISDADGHFNLKSRYDTGHGDEVGEISRAFDGLLDRLQDTSVSRLYFTQVIEYIGNALFVTDDNGRITLANAAAADLAECDRQQLIGSPLSLVIPFAATPDTDCTQDCICLSANGQSIPISCTRTMLAEGEVYVAVDLRERLAAESRLKLAAKVIEEATQGVIITDTNGTIISVNPAFCAISGYSRDEAIGKNPKFLKSGRHDVAFYESMWHTLIKKGHWQGEVWNRRKSGEIFPEWLNMSSVRNDNGEITNFVALFADITEKKFQEEQLKFIAFHDSLTGLPNRSLLAERLDQAIARRHRQDDIFAVLFLDLDRFKLVNDTLGHGIGDELLKVVSERLCACVRATDTVCRQGGDEFILVLTDIKEARAAGRVAEKILQSLAAPIEIDGHSISTSFSIGIALCRDDADDADNLLKNADLAMYQAKESGRNTFRYFNNKMNGMAKDRMSLENGLRKALDESELLLYYQPQYDIQSGTLIGAEALVRWNDPVAGIVMPAAFIPIAEETGLITLIGEWVIDEGFRQLAEWSRQYDTNLRMAINVSAVQFRRCDLVRTVSGALEKHGIEPNRIELEITESLLMQDDHRITGTLKGLKRLGVSLAIDDFGTGYSSLSYLRRFNVDCLKIDQSFVRDLGTGEDQNAIVRAVIDMARNLKLALVAEGVENNQQLELLRNMGCHTAQGYLFARPLAAAAFAEHIKRIQS